MSTLSLKNLQGGFDRVVTFSPLMFDTFASLEDLPDASSFPVGHVVYVPEHAHPLSFSDLSSGMPQGIPTRALSKVFIKSSPDISSEVIPDNATISFEVGPYWFHSSPVSSPYPARVIGVFRLLPFITSREYWAYTTQSFTYPVIGGLPVPLTPGWNYHYFSVNMPSALTHSVISKQRPPDLRLVRYTGSSPYAKFLISQYPQTVPGGFYINDDGWKLIPPSTGNSKEVLL